MEGFFQDLASRGTTVDTDEMIRIPERPSKANTFEDLGTSFDRKGNTTRREAKKKAESPYTHRLKHAKPSSTCLAHELTDSSEDELDSFTASQASGKSNAGSSVCRTPRLTRDEDYMCHVNQTTKPTHEVLRKMTFKKKGAKESNTEAGPAYSRLSPSKQPRKATSTHHDNRTGSSSGLHRSSSQNLINIEHIRSQGAIYTPGDLRAENISSDRPKPRPSNKGGKRLLGEISVNSQAESKSRVTGKIEIGEPETVRETKKPTDISLTGQGKWAKVKNVKEEAEVTPNTRSSKDRTKESRSMVSTSKPVATVKKPKIHSLAPERTPSPQTPQAFPAPSPLVAHRRDNVHKSPSMPNLRSKRRTNVDLCESPTPKPREFPVSLTMEIRRSTPPRPASDSREAKRIPKPRPKNSKSKKAKEAKSLPIEESEDADKEDEESSRPAPQPFPMCTQVLATIGETNSLELSGLKRASGGSFSSQKPRKKRKSALVVSSDESLKGYNDDDEDWDEDFSMSLTVDPKLLCPFCDALLPEPATPHLKKLIRNALKKSRPDPRPNNPLGRKAPSALFVTICQRHQFEGEELPKADVNGWPRSIDWKKLEKRVRNMRDELQSFLTDLPAQAGISVFWDEIQLELQKKGSRAVASIQGQFATFDKGQPGYYGELGYAIIHETLLDLFPPNSYDLNFIAPLTFKQFMQRVLVPEVAIRLIQEDMNLHGASGSSKALQVLRDSSKYGVVMFPDDNADKGDIDDLDQLGAADLIIMERARKRRIELEEEEIREEAEEEARRIEKQTKDKQSKTRREREKKKRNKSKEKESSSEDAQVLPPRPRPKSKFRPKRKETFFPHTPSSLDELSNNELMDYCPSFLKSSQDSVKNTRRNEYLKTRSAYGLSGTEEEVLVPNSDPDEDSGYSPFTPTYARNSQSLKSTQSGISTEPASSSEDIEVSSPVRQRHVQKTEEADMTPKPLKVGRREPSGSSQVKSYPLLAARRRQQTRVGNESLNSDATASEGPWLKSMIPAGSSTEATTTTASMVRRNSDHRWLLSDSCEE